MAVALAIGSGLVATIAAHRLLPVPIQLAVFAVLAAWFNSLQHEIIHGHPTPWSRCNRLLASVPVGLTYPYPEYRRSHLEHHRDELLTDPLCDPESYYVTREDWARRSAPARALLLVLQTLAGRIVLGPVVYALRFWRSYARRLASSSELRRDAGVHVLSCVALLAIVASTGQSVAVYAVGAAWGGAGLSLVRSFAEHRAVTHGSRSAVIYAGRFFSLLFLHLNLHDTHHERPGVPWYRLPAEHLRIDRTDEVAIGAGIYQGYREVARRHFLRPIWAPEHPSVLHS